MLCAVTTGDERLRSGLVKGDQQTALLEAAAAYQQVRIT